MRTHCCSKVVLLEKHAGCVSAQHPINKGESMRRIRLQLSVGLKPGQLLTFCAHRKALCCVPWIVSAELTRQWRTEIGSAGVAFPSRADPSPEKHTTRNAHTHTHTHRPTHRVSRARPVFCNASSLQHLHTPWISS